MIPLFLLCAVGLVQPTENVSVGSLDLTAVRQGWGTAHRDLSVEGRPLSIGGRKFAHGLGTHSPGVLVIDLNKGSTRFSGLVGIDDEVGKRGSATFAVVADGKMLWETEVRHGGERAVPFDLDVRGKKTLMLLVGDARDGFEYDHADWAEATLEVEGKEPRAMKLLAGPNPLIAGSNPHILKLTAPEVVGTRAGIPFLLSISAVGDAPIRFEAKGLPEGLRLDRESGTVAGSVLSPGIYDTQITASNPSGSKSSRLKIKAEGEFALTPPLGWNSYDSYGDDVTESEILANANYLKKNLAPYGYSYVVVDYRWYDPGASLAPNNPGARAGAKLAADSFGRLEPADNRFPSAQDGNGFKSLGDAIHKMGLKFGIHVMRGIPRQSVKANTPIEGSEFRAADAANTSSICGWCPDMYGVDASKPAGQAWYDSILRQYAAWGVDLIKVDDMSSPYARLEIEAVRQAVDKCGRSIVLSLSPGETPLRDADNVVKNANMWRISGDFWDDWGALDHEFDLLAAWSSHGKPGHWPDADMIPLGHLSVHGRSVGPDRRTRFTQNEQMTLISLWALAPSPFMLGMNLPDNDSFTQALLTNEEVLAVDQDPSAERARRLDLSEMPIGVEVWLRTLSDGSRAVGVFNRSVLPERVNLKWSQLGLAGVWRGRNLWGRTRVGNRLGATANVAPHGCVLLRVSR